MLLTCYACPTPIALFQRFKAIGVGETQQLLKPVKSNNSCVQTQHLKPVK
jgi:hypothetical protein